MKLETVVAKLKAMERPTDFLTITYQSNLDSKMAAAYKKSAGKLNLFRVTTELVQTGINYENKSSVQARGEVEKRFAKDGHEIVRTDNYEKYADAPAYTVQHNTKTDKYYLCINPLPANGHKAVVIESRDADGKVLTTFTEAELKTMDEEQHIFQPSFWKEPVKKINESTGKDETIYFKKVALDDIIDLK